MIRHLLTTLLLVNGSLAVTFSIFYQLVMICLQFRITPWIALVVTLAGCAFVFYRQRWARRSSYPFYEQRQPDFLGE